MLTRQIAVRLTFMVACGIALQAVPAAGQAGDHAASSAFKNIGYTLGDSLTANSDADDESKDAATTPPSPPFQAAPVGEPVASRAVGTACASGCCCQPCCTKAKKAALKQAAASAHKNLFYNNDFSYLKDPCYDGCLYGDCLKNLCHGNFRYDVGGQARLRMHHEENHRGLGLTGVSDDFLLSRTRIYLDANWGSNIRFYGEVLDANSSFEDFAPRSIEENRWDAQNLFLDLTLLEDCGKELVARGGRQEISLGAQRYASPLDWANTRRTFDGGRLLYTTPDWSVDGFWLAPMVRDRDDFDEANEDIAFYGVYSTYQALANGTVDLYWLALDNDAAGFYFDSIGGRYNGTLGDLLFEAEGAYQFGSNADGSDHDAGFFTVGAGKSWTNFACKPTTAWLYFDWASGADQQGAGNGHHHFFPLAHKYNGFMDLFGRRNLIDVNLLTTMKLTEKVTLLTWFHAFWLENDNDTPYNVNMSAFAPGVTPGDDELGQEIDTVLTIGLSERSNILFGYSYFWAGDYYDTPGLPFNGDADFFYTQYTKNF